MFLFLFIAYDKFAAFLIVGNVNIRIFLTTDGKNKLAFVQAVPSKVDLLVWWNCLSVFVIALLADIKVDGGIVLENNRCCSIIVIKCYSCDIFSIFRFL